MVKKILPVVAFSGCSQTKAQANVIKAVVEKVVKKAAPKVGGGATYVPFSEIAKQ